MKKKNKIQFNLPYNENIEKEILDQLYSLKETNEKLILPVNWQL